MSSFCEALRFDYDAPVPTRYDDLTDAQLARILALSRASRRAVKLCLHDLGQPARSEDVDAVLSYIATSPRHAEIAALSNAYVETAAAPPATFDPIGDTCRELIRRGETTGQFAARVKDSHDIDERLTVHILAGTIDPPASVLRAIMESAGARTVHFEKSRRPEPPRAGD